MFGIRLIIVFLLIILSCIYLTCASTDENLTERIIGGNAAYKKAWPFIVAVTNGRQFNCGASLIHPLWILTAAHCVPYNSSLAEIYRKVLGPMGVSIGPEDTEHVLQSEIFLIKPVVDGYTTAVKEVVEIEKYVVHPDYRRFKADGMFENAIHDLALLKLPESKKAPKSIKKIEIAKARAKDGSSCITAGWGVGKLPDVVRNFSNKNILYELIIFIDTKVCEEINKRNNIIFQNTPFAGIDTMQNIICARSRSLSESPFHGDSGDPLVCDNKLQGVLSSVMAAFNGKQPVFFSLITDIIPYRHWIHEVIRNDKTSTIITEYNSSSNTGIDKLFLLGSLTVLYELG